MHGHTQVIATELSDVTGRMGGRGCIEYMRELKESVAVNVIAEGVN